jgi:hypothetical protein
VGIILAQVLFGNLCQIGQSNSLTELLGFNITNEKTLISWKTKSNNKITPKNLLIAFQEVNKKLTHSYSEQILAEMAGIIGDCLNYDSTKRPTAAEVYGRWVNVYIKMTDS